ncbi:MAG: DUF4350 domain-containing protein [Methanomicrobiales archaeon]
MADLRWVAGGFAALALLLLFAHATVTTAEYSRYNPGWNGTSQFCDRAETAGAVYVYDDAALAGRTGALLLVIAPENATDTGGLHDFVAAGNTLLVADESGAADRLLAEFGLTVDPVPVASMDMEYSDPGSVIARPVATHTLLAGVDRLVFNRPSSVTGGEALVKTSVLSWRDLDADDTMDSGEALQRSTLMARASAGEGEVVVVADPSLFINGMVTARRLPGNERFLAHLISWNGTLLIDQHRSRTAVSGPAGQAVAMLHAMPLSSSILIGICILGVALAYRRTGTRP